MAMYTADQDGKVQIRHEADGVVLSFAICGTEAGVFQPGQAVEIADERLASLITQLGGPLGVGREGTNDGSID